MYISIIYLAATTLFTSIDQHHREQAQIDTLKFCNMYTAGEVSAKAFKQNQDKIESVYKLQYPVLTLERREILTIEANKIISKNKKK